MRQFFDAMILPLAGISFAGFLCITGIHLAAIAQLHWVAEIPRWLISIVWGLGFVLVILTVIYAWGWPWAELWDNLTDGMSKQALILIVLAFAYTVLVMMKSGGRYSAVQQIMDPESWTPIMRIWQMTGYLIPLYFVPAMYFWKERPQ